MNGQRAGVAAALLVIAAAVVAAFLIFGDTAPDRDGSAPPRGSEAGSTGRGENGTEAGTAGGTIDAVPERVLLHPPGGGAADGDVGPVLVKGKVSNPEGAPLQGVVVSFQESDETGEGGFAAAAVESGPVGSYAAAVAPGRYTVAARIRSSMRGHDLWYEPARIEIPPAKEFVHHILFTRPLCSIRGKAYLVAGGPLQGIGVALGTLQGKFIRRMETGADGLFQFEGVAPGDYRFLFERGPRNRRLIFPWKESRAPERSAERWPKLRVKPGDRELRVDLPMAEPLKVTGRAVVPGGVVSRNLVLFLREDPQKTESRLVGETRLYSSMVRDDGTVGFHTVYPGPYLAYIHGIPEGRARPDPLPVTIDPFSEGQERLFSFVPAGGGLSLEGRVVDQRGNPVPGERLVLWDSDSSPDTRGSKNIFARGEAVAGADGAFSFLGLHPGTYRLRRAFSVAAPGRPLLIDERREVSVVLTPEEPGTPAAWKVFALDRTTVRGVIDDFESTFTDEGSRVLEVRVAVRLSPADGVPEYTTFCYPNRKGGFVLTEVPRVSTPVRIEVNLEIENGKEIAFARTSVLLEPEGDTEVVLKRGGS